VTTGLEKAAESAHYAEDTSLRGKEEAVAEAHFRFRDSRVSPEILLLSETLFVNEGREEMYVQGSVSVGRLARQPETVNLDFQRRRPIFRNSRYYRCTLADVQATDGSFPWTRPPKR
jgi:hypothetical protein